MTDAQKKQLQDKIQSELLRLEQDIQGLVELTSPAALEGLDEVSRMDAIVSKSVHDASLAAARNRTIALKRALKRIEEDDEDYGYCDECGEEIPFPRLFSMPEALRCVDCAE